MAPSHYEPGQEAQLGAPGAAQPALAGAEAGAPPPQAGSRDAGRASEQETVRL